MLWTSAQPAVAAFIRTLVPRWDEADELLQQTATVLVGKFRQYDRRRPFVAWAIGVAKMKLLTYRREKALGRVMFDGALVEQIAEDYRQMAEDRLPIGELLIQCIAELDGRARGDPTAICRGDENAADCRNTGVVARCCPRSANPG